MSEVSAFDPNAFLEAQITEVTERRAPLPEHNPSTPDGLYTAVVGAPTVGGTGTIGKGDKMGQPWLQMVIPLSIEVPAEFQTSLKLPAVLKISDRPFINLTAAGTIDNTPGANMRMKAYRDATGMNNPGDAFSWRKLEGQVVKVKIKHEMYEDTIRENISQVLKA